MNRGGATESAILQREDPEAKKAREGNIEAGAAIIKRAQSQPGVKLPDPATEVLGPEIHPGPSDLPDYQSGKTPLRPGDIDRLAAYNTRHRRGDPFEGHEVSQNAWLVLKGLIGKRNKGPISRGNPSLALTEEEHLRVGKEQGKLGLNDQAQLAKMSPTEMLQKNIQALENAGIERSRIEMIRREAEAALSKATGTTISTR